MHSVRKKVVVGLLFIAATLPTVGRSAESTQGELILDAKNRMVQIHGPVHRIVVLPSDVLEVIRILDATHLVAGVNSSIEETSLFWPDLNTRVKVGHPFEPSLEQIVSIWPDLVLAYGWRPGPGLETKLVPLGIQVLRLDFYRMSTQVREIRDFGRLIGKSAAAEVYATWHADCVAVLEAGLKNRTRNANVYLEGYTDYNTYGPGSGGYEMGIMAGANLISSEDSLSNQEISTEFIVGEDPEIIVKMVSGLNSYDDDTSDALKSVWDNMLQRPGWSRLSAVQSGRVYTIAADIGPGPRGIIGVLYMAKLIYPEVFETIDVEAFHREYLERFQGVSYRGTYVFPEM